LQALGGAKEMKNSDIYVGIRLSKSELEIGVLPEELIWNVLTEEQELLNLIKRLVTMRPRIIILDQMNLNSFMKELLEAAGLMLQTVDHRALSKFMNATQHKAPLPDSSLPEELPPCNALALAKYGESEWCTLQLNKNKQASEIEALLVRRSQLLEMLSSEKNHFRKAARQLRGKIELHIKWLQKSIREIDKDADYSIKKLNGWPAEKKAIQIVPGAGPNWAEFG
jgi:transposase